MRRRLRKFLPIVLIVLAVQIFAPIGATWAASITAADPLHAASICSGAASPAGQADQTGQHQAYDGCCSACTVFYTGVSLDTPRVAVAAAYRQFLRVVWFESAPELFGRRTGSHSQARAPPRLT